MSQFKIAVQKLPPSQRLCLEMTRARRMGYSKVEYDVNKMKMTRKRNDVQRERGRERER